MSGRTLVKRDPTAGERDASPQGKRDQGGKPAPQRLALTGEHFFSYGKGKTGRQHQKPHLVPERRTVVALDRLRKKHRHAGCDDCNKRSFQPWVNFGRQFCNGLREKAKSHQSQVHQQHGATQHRQRQQVNALDDWKQPKRFPHYGADRCRFKPFEKR